MVRISLEQEKQLNRTRDSFSKEQENGKMNRVRMEEVLREEAREDRLKTNQMIVECDRMGIPRTQIYSVGLGVQNSKRVYEALREAAKDDVLRSAISQTIEVMQPAHWERFGGDAPVLQVDVSSGRMFDVFIEPSTLIISVDRGKPTDFRPKPDHEGDDQKLVDQNWSMLYEKFVGLWPSLLSVALLPVSPDEFVNDVPPFWEARSGRGAPGGGRSQPVVEEDDDDWGAED